MHHEVRWILGRQVLVTVVAAVLAGVVQGVHGAISALIGGGIAVLGGGVYAWRALRMRIDPRAAFRGQVAGEGYKLAITLFLFVLVFKGYGQLQALPLLLAYAATIVVYWIALLAQR